LAWFVHIIGWLELTIFIKNGEKNDKNI